MVESAHQRHFSGAISRQVVGFVRDEAGEDGVRKLLALAGEDRPVEELESLECWSSYDQARRLIEAASDVLGDPFAMRRIGESFVLNMENSTEVTVLLQSLGSPAEVLRNITQAAAKFSTAVDMRAVSVEAHSAVVEAIDVPEFPRFQQLCDYTAGLLAFAPGLFGLPPATVDETECVLRGDSRCLFQVEWGGGDEALSPAERELAQARAQVEVLASRFRTLHAAVQELVLASDVEAVLQRIVRMAGLAVRAPKYLLAIRPRDDAPLVVHAEGLDAETAQRIAEDVLTDVNTDASRLVVEVASVNRSYGRLAALYPSHATFFAEERHMLEQYAALAAVALDSAGALETARREADTAQALLRLARSVTNVSSTEELACRIAEIVPLVIECDQVSVVVWEEATQTLRVGATHGLPPELAAAAKNLALTRDDTPVLTGLLQHPEPVLVDRGTHDGFLLGLMEAFNIVGFLAVPVATSSRFFGAITVAVTDDIGRLASDGAVAARLYGLADIAVHAFENARLVEEIRDQASHDPLTGLPNQRLLRDRVTTGLSAAKRSADRCALLFVDLDRFKHINDSFGHSAGDLLLREVGRRFDSALRESDTVGRLGGDEFVVFLTQLESGAEAEEVAARLLGSLDEPLTVLGEHLPVSGSIGIAVAPEHGNDYDSLMQHADVAMYAAKRKGGRRFSTYRAASNDLPNRMSLETGLRRAVENDELVLLFQPQVDLTSCVPVAAEALVRWHHPTAGVLGPDDFLPIARECGLMPEIDLRVLELACAQVTALRAVGWDIRIAVNFSPDTVAQPGLGKRVSSIFASSGVTPNVIEVEVTEEAVSDDTDLLRCVAQLKALGLRVALDDFGTGQSSLSRLDPSLIDVVKIDRSFVAALHDRRLVIDAIIGMAHALGMDVIAEGVEVAGQAEALRVAGCDLAQGYFYSRPVPAADLASALTACAAPKG